MRRGLFLSTLILGVVACVIAYFVLAAPIGPTDGPHTSNPRMLFAPGIFVIGVILIFTSAVVYELVPDRRGK